MYIDQLNEGLETSKGPLGTSKVSTLEVPKKSLELSLKNPQILICLA